MLVKYVDPQEPGVVIVVDVAEEAGYEPASAAERLEGLREAVGLSMERALDPVFALGRLARRRIDALDASERPASFTISTGVELGGEVGFLVAKGSAKATLEVAIAWSAAP